MKQLRKVLAVVMSLALLIAAVPMSPATAEAVSGKCGEALTWELADGTLTISGTGAMDDYSSVDLAPWYAYAGDITQIVFQSDVTTVGSYAFYGCTALESLELPGTLTGFGSYAFSTCPMLRKVHVAEGVTDLGHCTFYACAQLKDVSLPSTLKSLGSGVFAFCIGLESISIPEGVTEIEHSSFCGCSALQSVQLPQSLDTVAGGAFISCDALTDVYYNGTAEQWVQIIVDEDNECLLNAMLHTTAPVTPDNTCGEDLTWELVDGVLSISGTGMMDDFTLSTHPWYEYRNEITDVQIMEGVTNIGNMAFYCLENLQTVSIPDSVTEIGDDAFFDCFNLRSITIPANVTDIGNHAFYCCSSLESLVIPDSMTRIAYHTFEKCSALQSITIPVSVTDISGYAFCGCDSLTDVYYGGTEEAWTQIAVGELNDPLLNAAVHFDTAAELTGIAVTAPDKIRYYCYEELDLTGMVVTAFYSDGSRQIVTEGYEVSGYSTAPSGTKTITVTYQGFTDNFEVRVIVPSGSCGENVKWMLNSTLTTLNISGEGDMTDYENLDDRPWMAFADSVTSIVIKAGVTSIGDHAFFGMQNVSKVTIPGSVSEIGEYAFGECDSLQTLQLHEGTVTIGFAAFCGCDSLYRVRLPLSLSNIEEVAFDACGSLADVYYYGGSEEWAQVQIHPSNIALTSAKFHSYPVKSLSVTAPEKTCYMTGETLDLTGLTVTAIFNSGIEINIQSGYVLSGYDMSVAGEQTVTVTYRDASAAFAITVEEAPVPENAGQVIVSNVLGVNGKTVDVTLYLQNNPGIASMKLKIHYDSSVLTLVEVLDGGILGESVHKPQLVSPYTLNWVNDLATENFTGDGLLVTLRFAIAEDAPEGVYGITATYDASASDIMDKDLCDVAMEIVNGSVDVADVLPGDVNRDGVVNARDRAILTRYLADWEGYEIDPRGADVNEDGVVDARDRAILARYLGDWEEYSQLPYVV